MYKHVTCIVYTSTIACLCIYFIMYILHAKEFEIVDISSPQLPYMTLYTFSNCAYKSSSMCFHGDLLYIYTRHMYTQCRASQILFLSYLYADIIFIFLLK